MSNSLSLAEILPIPRVSYKNCTISFQDSGVVPDVSKLDRVEELLEDIFKSLDAISFVSSLLTVHRKIFEPLVVALVQSPSQSKTEALLRSLKSHLHSQNKLHREEVAELQRIALVLFSPTIASLINHTGMVPAIIDMNSLPRRILELESVKRRVGGIDYQIKHTASSLCGMFMGTPASRLFVHAQIYQILEPLAPQLLESVTQFLKLPVSLPKRDALEMLLHLTGSRILLYSNLVSSSQLRGESVDDALENLPVFCMTELVELAMMGGEPMTIWMLENLKLSADRQAGEKNYDGAISTYCAVYEILPTVNALANSAAVRLRAAKDGDIYQFQLVVIECTFALELEPNHVKALFRRGLAHCKLKMWNEGIIDFQRAVELDPRSPAAAELAYALRQVTRRIEA